MISEKTFAHYVTQIFLDILGSFLLLQYIAQKFEDKIKNFDATLH